MNVTTQDASSTIGPESLAIQRKLVLNLEKVLRSYRLYEARGAQYEAHVNELAGQAALATELAQVAVNLSPFGPFLDGEEPPSDGDYARQWFTLFEEGARQIVFMPGIDGRELRELLHIICAEAEDNEDIVTLLWRKELKHVQIYVARVLMRSISGGAEKSSSIQEELGRWKAVLTQSAALAANDDDRDPTEELVQLSPDDFRVLSLEEHAFDWCSLSSEANYEHAEKGRKPRLADAADKEISDFGRFLDLAGDVGEEADQIILDVIAGMTRMGSSEDLNRMICTVAKRGGKSTRSLSKFLDNQEGLDSLLPLIEASPSSFKDSLSALSEVNADAVSALMQKVEQSEVRDALEGFVATAEDAPMHYYSERLLSENSEEAIEAVEALMSLGTDEAFILAVGGFKSTLPTVRRQVMRKVFERFSPTLAYMVKQALLDIDKGIRILTLRFIGDNGSTNLLRDVIKLMKQRDFIKRDYNERIAFVRAIGRHTRLPVINTYLCEILLEYRLFGSREMLEYQIEVARLLLRSNNPEARDAIKKILNRWSVPDEVKQTIRQEQIRLSDEDIQDDRSVMVTTDSFRSMTDDSVDEAIPIPVEDEQE
jgi:hypothetical protein